MNVKWGIALAGLVLGFVGLFLGMTAVTSGDARCASPWASADEQFKTEIESTRDGATLAAVNVCGDKRDGLEKVAYTLVFLGLGGLLGGGYAVATESPEPQRARKA